MKEFFTFRKMITPYLVQILFWISIVLFVFITIVDIIHQVNWRIILEIIILGPLASRIICELLILLFRINDHLAAIKTHLVKSNYGQT
jgi:hypothetical protein